MRLGIRTRKLIGTIILLIGLTLYSFLIMTIAVSGHLPEHGLVQFLYYITAGVIWAFPAKYLIVWMVRPDEA
ncbi:DUF2842 domain-containing protein [Parvibaculum sp.]|uniref:DUF2842 domain-containing protein n=1 Tax=Parvibaculum sp. TaxID=2024848 RepID=UPI000C4D3F3F|nr:DUF2842 domain-containing protein [Parvibaculum sp.]MAM93761.1 hypothetical protein [Parvibaculum sp.]HCX68034.1 DUF2842 domain-containing protein [Rhodobiaceae bacterium]|tara:strand:+ start:2962 stop:3177 length:216 start_codon:yes stop_codon:yes gene_type:complete